MLLERASRNLQIPVPVLSGISRRASHSYKRYEIAKRNGGSRTIHHPSRKLKALQRWLLREVIEQWPVHEAAYAYRPGRGIKQHAAVHAKGNYLLRMDFQNFFPSLRRAHIAALVATNPPGVAGWTVGDLEFFLNIVCKGDALTIGAPTSPTLSNALCFSLDVQLTAVAAERGAWYSRYADDLFFSTINRDVLTGLSDDVRRIVADLTLPNGLAVNEEKTHHTSRKWRREVTGLVLTPEGDISLGRERKRFIRGLIHRYVDLNHEEQASLRGLLVFARGIEPDFINRLVLKYGAGQIEIALGSGAKANNP